MKISQNSLLGRFIILALLIFGLHTAIISAQDTPILAEISPEPATQLPEPSPTETPTDLPTAVPATETLQPTETLPEPTSDSPTATPTETATLAPTDSLPDAPTALPTATLPLLIPPEGAMRLLVRDLLDSGDLSHWQFGEGWALVPNPDGGYALQTSSTSAAHLTKGVYYNAAAQMRFALNGGTAGLSLRVSAAGSYTAALDAGGALLLFRGDTLLASALTTAGSGWHTLRLSVNNDILRVAVDEVEQIVAQDSAPLPPGEIEIAAGMIAATPILADDFFLFVPETDYSLYPPPTEVPILATEVLIPTATATASPVPTVTEIPATATLIPADRMQAEAEDDHISRYGQWQPASVPFASGGQILVSSGQDGDALDVFFGGSDITVVYINGLANATLSLSLDGNLQQTVTTTQQASATRAEIHLSGLSANPHQLRLESLGGAAALDSVILASFISPLTVLNDMSGISGDVIAALEQQETVPVIVYFKTSPVAAAASGVSAAAAPMVSASISNQRDNLLADLPSNQVELAAPFQLVPAVAAEVTENGLVALQENPLVETIQLDIPVYTSLAESRALIHVPAVEAAYGITGAGVNVAILDTGVAATHPALADSLLAQKCFLTQGCPGGGTSGSNARDGHGHGTHVTGIITSNNATYRGIATSAGIVAVKVLNDTGSGYFSDVVRGLEWVYLNRTLYNIRLVNLSLGSGGYTGNCDAAYPALTNIVNQLYNAGVVVFAASGNSSSSTQISIPACVSNVVSVGSIIDSGGLINRVSAFSNANSNLDLLAPGESIISTIPGGGFIALRGTSMASPTAAGVAALVLQSNPTISAAALVALLKSTGVPVRDTRNGQTYPRVDALNAIGKVPVSAVTLNTPTGIDTQRPTIRWTLQNISTAYQFQVAIRIPNQVVFRHWYTRAEVCGSATGTTCALTLPNNLVNNRTYSAAVAQQTPAGVSAETYTSFTVAVPAPGSATPGATTGTDTLRPTVNWSLQGSALYAADFQITITGSNAIVVKRWYTRTAACGSVTGTTCSIRVPTDLVNNRDYALSLTPRSAGGTGNALSSVFTVEVPNPGTVTLNSVMPMTTSRPTVSWTLEGHALYADQFEVYMYSASGTALKRWYTRAEVCGSATGTTCSLPIRVTLKKGVGYTISVRPRGVGGTGNYTSTTYTPI
jgi:hypothetical protein